MLLPVHYLNTHEHRQDDKPIDILAIFYPPLKQIWGCSGLSLQTWKGNIYFTELAERVECGKYDRAGGVGGGRELPGPLISRDQRGSGSSDDHDNHYYYDYDYDYYYLYLYYSLSLSLYIYIYKNPTYSYSIIIILLIIIPIYIYINPMFILLFIILLCTYVYTYIYIYMYIIIPGRATVRRRGGGQRRSQICFVQAST